MVRLINHSIIVSFAVVMVNIVMMSSALRRTLTRRLSTQLFTNSESTAKTFLSVPFAERDEAKLLGARWDPANKSWYAPNREKELLDRWPEASLTNNTNTNGYSKSYSNSNGSNSSFNGKSFSSYSNPSSNSFADNDGNNYSNYTREDDISTMAMFGMDQSIDQIGKSFDTNGSMYSSSNSNGDASGEKTYLVVPFEEKDEAKLLGARWDGNVKKWFAPKGERELLDRWPAIKVNIPDNFRAAINGDSKNGLEYKGNKTYNIANVFGGESSGEKTYLTVPFGEKEEAKMLGARWDKAAKSWFAPYGEKELLDRWPVNSAAMNGNITNKTFETVSTPSKSMDDKSSRDATTGILSELVGEDRTFGGNKLFVDLIPSTCWFTNVRSCIDPNDWNRLRKLVYERANNRCECCGSASIINTPTQLEAHERWEYDDKWKAQRLKRIIALCRSCHEATHMGLAENRGRGKEAKEHLMRVNQFTKEECDQHVDEAFSVWLSRAGFDWDLDLSLMTRNNIKLVRSFAADEREDFATEELSKLTK